MTEPFQQISHGVKPTLEKLSRAEDQVCDLNTRADLPFTSALTSQTSRFDYLFSDLQAAAAWLPELPEMRTLLINLGASMVEPTFRQSGDSAIPSAYTYFGQFVDHDITLEAKSDDIVKLSDAEFRV